MRYGVAPRPMAAKDHKKPTAGSAALARLTQRPGEGVTLPVTAKVTAQPDGTSAVEIQLNLQQAPVPERRFYAEFAWVSPPVDTGVQIVFGQRKFDGGVRSAVVVMMTPEAVRSFLTTCRVFLPQLREFMSRNGLAKPELKPVSDEPNQCVTVVANIIAAAYAAREANLDLYHSSPWSLMAVQGGSDIALDPILRVDLSVMLLSALLERLSELEPKLPTETK